MRAGAFGASALTLLLALSRAGAAADPDPFAIAIARAQRNVATEKGKAYVEPLVQSLGPSLESALKQCFPKGKTEPMRFTMVLLVDQDGLLSDKMAQPNNEQTQCVLHGIRSTHVPTPPEPNWWVLVHMKIEP